jgi:hypothetical protein
MTRLKISQAVIVAVLALTFSATAGAAYVITPIDTPDCPSAPCLEALGNDTSQNDIDDIIAPLLGSAVELYKANDQDPPAPPTESGSAAAWYETTFDPAGDPEDADITHVTGQPSIGGIPIFLLVKDGNQEPAWYLFNISDWNGTETIEVRNFWPQQGGISHVTIYGGTSVPDGGVTLMLLGCALVGVETLRRRFRA